MTPTLLHPAGSPPRPVTPPAVDPSRPTAWYPPLTYLPAEPVPTPRRATSGRLIRPCPPHPAGTPVRDQLVARFTAGLHKQLGLDPDVAGPLAEKLVDALADYAADQRQQAHQ